MNLSVKMGWVIHVFARRRAYLGALGAGLLAFSFAACRGKVSIPDPDGQGGEGGGPGVDTGSWGAPGGAGGAGSKNVSFVPTFEETGSKTACSIDITAALAVDMPTVAQVEMIVEGLNAEVTGGVIQFGLDELTMEAPLEVGESGFSTLLWGMKPEREYSFRVGLSTGDQYCYSETKTIRTGGLRAGILPLRTMEVTDTVTPGFVIAPQGPRVVIFDQDGDIVWGYSLARLKAFRASCGGGATVGNIFAAKLSYDGRYMLARDLGPFDCGDGGTFFRIALDGSEALPIELPGGDHHDFTVTPDGITYIAKQKNGGFDQLFTAKSDGSDARALLDLRPLVDAYPKSGGPGKELSHFNVVRYYEDRDIYTVSNRESDSIGIISGSGEIVAGIGKTAEAEFETIPAESTDFGPGEQLWRVQHGHDLYAPDKLLVFSNGTFVDGRSHVLHYSIEDGLARLDWSYDGMGSSSTQGDVQMLPNGQVLVCASNAGTIHLLGEAQVPVAKYRAAEGGFGYVTYRESLYGAPPNGR